MPEFEFISPDDKAALLGLSSPELSQIARPTVIDLGYKLHQAQTHDQFQERFAQAQYELVLLEDLFDCPIPQQNISLTTLQGMQMARRRHATIVLFGEDFETLNSMQAYQQSVHAVINKRDLAKLKSILQQVLNDSSMFMNVFKDVQLRFAQGKR